MTPAEIKRLYEALKEQHAAMASAMPVNTAETPAEKRKRIATLEKEGNDEEWIKYYFPNYAKAPSAKFHITSTGYVMTHPEFILVREWSRELAKSTRTMVEVLKLTLTGKKFNVLLISNSLDNAERLLLPYMINLEHNPRIINDYGEQANLGSWSIGEFITKKGVAFRAIGAGQSPRGSRNEAIRPDIILFDDLDTDADCLNPDIINKRWKWVEEAVIPTRSISNALLVIWCGNKISEDCCVVRAEKTADRVEVVNIRGEDGLSSWPEKNSEKDIDRVLSTISYAAQQKEYFNNPMSVGRTFPELKWDKCPPLKEMQFVVVYGDPATSNKDKPGQKSNLSNSRKAVFIVGKKGSVYYIYKGYLDVMSNANYIASYYACRDYIGRQCQAYYYIENNTLQDPFFQQVLRPLFYAYGKDHGGELSVMGDGRKKDEKWYRIEAVLEPLNRLGNLVFNIDEKNDPHMDRLATQFISATINSKQLDGPDCIEGAVFKVNEKSGALATGAFKYRKRVRSDTKGY